MSLADVLAALPGLVWAGLAAFLVVRFHRPLRDELLPRLTGVKVMGLQLDLRSDEIQQAVESVPREGVTYPPELGATLLSRAERSSPVVRDTSILWIDDTPGFTLVERRLLSRLGVFVETATSTEDAIQRLRTANASDIRFDVVISDMSRPDDPETGASMATRLAEAAVMAPVIYYIGRVDPSRPRPVEAFGITDRPDELLHLVFDALERRSLLTRQ